VAVHDGTLGVVVGSQRWDLRAGDRDALVLGEPGASSGEEPDRESLVARGTRIVEGAIGAGLHERRETLRRSLRKSRARIDRRLQAVEQDLERMKSAEAAAERTRLFVHAAARAPRGATRLEAVDWSTGEARPAEMPLDPARGAQEQIDAVFQRARRLKRGAPFAVARLADARAAREKLDEIDLLLSAEDPDLSRLESQARAAAPRDFRLEPPAPTRRTPGTSTPTARPCHRTFVGASSKRILVGRGAAHNDTLTFRVARAHDLWLHAKGHAGAHVVVPLERGASCPADLLVEAAHLAAHFSDARDEPTVEVDYTPRRHVRKPRRSAPGQVAIDHPKVLLLRRNEETLRRLLEREET
jgi:predicted ribosome quality control (RQC) complex YloA/Tae2 family protein